MNIAVGIPWRGGDPWREQALAVVENHLIRSGLHPQRFDSGHDRFNRAASRNLAVASLDADAVILHDADMVAPAVAYTNAARLALTGVMVVGFRHYRPLSKLSTVAVFDGADPFTQPPVDQLTDFSVGGIIAITRKAWDQVGGMNEQFVDWGCEDFEFANAATEALGPVQRTDNPAVHLWHRHAGEHDHIAHNAALLAEGRHR